MSEKAFIKDPEKIRLNENQELQQILGNPPGWLLRWGTSFIAVGVVVILILGWLVKYPDVIPAKVVLTTQKPPIRVFAESSGKLIELRAKDKMAVKEGDILAVLDDPAEMNDVEKLDAILQKIENAVAKPDIVNIEIPRNLKLGSLQPVYAEFSKKFDNYTYFLKNNNTFSKIDNLKQQIIKLEELDQSLKGQVSTLQKVVDLAKKELDRNKKLRDEKIYSENVVELAEAEYLRSQRQLESLDNEIISNKLLVEKTKMQILEMTQDYSDGQSSGMFSIQEDIQKIRSEVASWKKTFQIRAPISGTVSLTKFRSAQEYINLNEELLTIVPEGDIEIVAKGILPSRGSGKVKPEMKANIRLDGYSYQEFGSLQCKVNGISLVPDKEGFIVELSVSQPMQTTYGKTITFQQEMQGTANIITEDRRILERIFDKILSIVFND